MLLLRQSTVGSPKFTFHRYTVRSRSPQSVNHNWELTVSKYGILSSIEVNISYIWDD